MTDVPVPSAMRGIQRYLQLARLLEKSHAVVAYLSEPPPSSPLALSLLLAKYLSLADAY